MWTRSRLNNEYIPGLFMVSVDRYENRRKESMWPQLVTIKTSKKSYEETSIRSGVSTLQRKGEGAPISYDTEIGGPKQKFVHDVRALGIRISEEAIDDNLYELNGGGEGSLRELFDDLGEAAEETIETEMARFFNSASATTYHTTRFGKAFAATDHPRLDGSTFSNYGTQTDLTYTSFWTGLIAAENQFNHRQFRIMKKVKNLWVPPQLESKGIEILNSSDRPDTGDRAVNAIKSSGRQINLKVWSHMTDTDMYVYQLEGKGILFFWNRKTRFARDKDFQTGDIMVKVDQRWSAEVHNEQDFYFNIPA